MTNQVTLSIPLEDVNKFRVLCNKRNLKMSQEVHRLMLDRIAVDEEIQATKDESHRIMQDKILSRIKPLVKK